ncbi:amphiphysin isoform X2 [Pristis pectinata]|uniref:amphiphysin isoform X2 n=1 Tax=Pristis pectinata TaxID=685728 RepID=UPI00223D6621|nr:amphiphysin isoform X2 [Pristis pectinata]
MADNIKTGVFAKNVQKRLNRAQEKVLQKLGKADETRDEQFEGFVQNFKKQEAEGCRLQRELRGYLTAVKGMQEASTKLTESLHEVYEPEWYGRDDIKTVGQNSDLLWADFHQKLVDQALLTLDTYLGQFPDIKTRIAKRSRKLVDYDCARHHLESLQHSRRRDDSKLIKAEEEFQKAQKVFEELNTDLQDELPSLWSSRVGFYVNTFRNISCIESKFHKEGAVLCHKLYEIMSKLGEQHADKAFTIQGAPSDSGPLRISKTPTPPEEPSPPGSPTTSPNHTLAPLAVSPAHTPTRPKSPSQLRKGPPVPPPPKLTPTKELQSENIINFFEDNFVPEINVTSSSQPEQPATQPGESLLDMDFDPFKPDQTSAATRSQSPHAQTLPWDLWEASTELVQPMPSAAFNGFTQLDAGLTGGTTELPNQSVFDTVINAEPTVIEEPKAPAAGTEPPQDAPSAVPSVVTEEVVEVKELEVQEPAVSAETEGIEEIKDPEVQKPAVNAATESTENVTSEKDTEQHAAFPEDSEASQVSVPSVVIQPASNNEGEDEGPAVNEVVDMQEADEMPAEEVSSPPAPSATEQTEEVRRTDAEQQVSAEGTGGSQEQSAPEVEAAKSQTMPPGFMYKVQAVHNFEAANEDELTLQRGDIVLVIPSETTEDQDAGWLTGIKESDWIQHGAANSSKGLFPKNFTQQLE